MNDQEAKRILNLEKLFLSWEQEILDNIKGLGSVPWRGISWNPLVHFLRRRESYLLGELRGCISARGRVTEVIDELKLRSKT